MMQQSGNTSVAVAGASLLLVEDNRAVSDTVRKIVNRFCAHELTAVDGPREALELFASGSHLSPVARQDGRAFPGSHAAARCAGFIRGAQRQKGASSMRHGAYKLIITAIGFLALIVVAGCNTMEGAGEDLEDAGEGIQDAADG
jgi:predicted small secreted protein